MAWTVVRTTTPEQHQEAMRLVHDAYVQAGHIILVPGGVRGRVWNNSEHTSTFVAERDRDVIGVMSVTVDSEIGLPSDHAFQAEIDKLRDRGLVSEASNLAILPDKSSVRLMRDLAEMCREQAYEWGCKCVFIAVSPHHTEFFRRVVGFEKCGAARSYSDETSDIVEGMVLEL